MPTQSHDYLVLGHSHAVCLLDAITDWRSTAGATARHQPDVRYSDQFQGWFSGGFPDELMDLDNRYSSSPTGKILARVITAASKINAAPKLETINGKDTLVLQNEFRDLISSLPDDLPIVSFMFGNEHARMMLGHLPPYDFHEPECALTCTDPEAIFLDSAYIDTYAGEWMGNPTRGLMAIRFLKRNRIVHVMPPPPRENPSKSKYMETLGEVVEKYGFAPDYLRLKWYKRYTRRLAELVESMGCNVIWPPEEALTADGLLREGFAEGLTHANSAYGLLLAERIHQQTGNMQ